MVSIILIYFNQGRVEVVNILKLKDSEEKTLVFLVELDFDLIKNTNRLSLTNYLSNKKLENL